MIDSLYIYVTNISKRAIASVYETIAYHSAFVTQIRMTYDEISEQTKQLVNIYKWAVPVSRICQILFNVFREQQLQGLLSSRFVWHHLTMLCRTFLCLMVTNCTGERSFSQLKRNASDHEQRKLNSLSRLCIESEKLREDSFDDITVDFAI